MRYYSKYINVANKKQMKRKLKREKKKGVRKLIKKRTNDKQEKR